MDFYLPLPKSAPKKSTAAIHRWRAKNYPKRADIRNMAKACEDALQGILFVNDSQVIRAGPDRKVYAVDGEGFTVIWVTPL
jgi:Holliday junction resolvase RusA-like endonuclease